jgi:hypothetical protein
VSFVIPVLPSALRTEAFNPSELHVVCAITNPARYRTRYELYKVFEKRMLDAGVTLWTAEGATGDRPHFITDANNPRHLQLRTPAEVWHKENLQNLLVQRLPHDWKYVACIDADVLFARPDWAVETIHQLQHHAVVQMFSECLDLGPTHGPVPFWNSKMTLPGMVTQFRKLGGVFGKKPYGQDVGHCGYAWAYRREAWETFGGLIDWSPCGANDHHMARGLLSNIRESVDAAVSPGFIAALDQWGARAKAIRRNVGIVEGLLLHSWHGKKANRKYKDRWQILVQNKFDPRTDLKKDFQGVYQLADDGSDRLVRLRDDLRTYFRNRNEDGTDV